MSRAQSTNPLLQILSPLHKANRQISIHIEERLTDLELTTVEAHLLCYVRTYGPCPIGELVRVLGHKKSTMTNILDRLEAYGLLQRSVNPNDRRSFLVATTETGDRIETDAQKRVYDLEEDILKLVTEEDMRGFRKVINAVADVTGITVRQTTQS